MKMHVLAFWFVASEGLVSAEITLTADDLPQPGKQFSGNIFVFHDSWEEKTKNYFKCSKSSDIYSIRIL